MTVRQMVHHLSHRPASFPVRRVQLRAVQAVHGCPDSCRGSGNLLDPVLPLFGAGIAVKTETTEGVSQVGGLALRHLLSGASELRVLPWMADVPLCVSPLNSKCCSCSTRSWMGTSEISSRRRRASTASATRAAGSHWPGVSVG